MARIDIKGVITASEDSWIYDWFGISHADPKTVLQALAENPEGETADIYINSQGGDLNAGVEIYEELRQYSGDIMIHIMQACSAASVIMCAGPSEISPAGLVMIHNVSGVFGGDHNDMAHAEQILRAVDKTVAGAYVNKTGKPLETWIDKMNAETWLSAEEAVELGLVDKISGSDDNKNGIVSIPKMAASTAGLLPADVINKMRSERATAAARLRLLNLRAEKEATKV